MSKKIKILLASIIALFIIIITNEVYAASGNIEALKKELQPGESTTITASVTDTEAWNLKITASGGTITGTAVSADSAGSEVTKEVISVKFSAVEEGTYTITLSGQVTGKDLIKKEVTGQSVKITVKKPPEEKPQENPTTPPEEKPIEQEPTEPEKPVEQTPTTEPQTPKTLEFTSVNETVYATGTVNVRGTYSSTGDYLGQLNEKDSVTRTGISKTTGKDGYSWSRIIFNGKTAYVISSKLTKEAPAIEQPTQEPEQPTEEPEDETNEGTETSEVKKGLKSLKIEGLELTPKFDPEVYEYRVIVKKDISKLEIKADPAVEGTTITVAGNKDLEEGENLITIVVYNANKEVEATYQITVNKNTLDLTETDSMLMLGTKEATRNLIIFIAILSIAIVTLIIILILKRRNKNNEEDYEENYEEDYPNMQEYTENEQNVENINENEEQEEEQEEIRRPRWEKRKGKHF